MGTRTFECNVNCEDLFQSCGMDAKKALNFPCFLHLPPNASKGAEDGDEILTEHCNGHVVLLWGVCVELAEVSSLIRNGDVGQRHSELAAGEIH